MIESKTEKQLLAGIKNHDHQQLLLEMMRKHLTTDEQMSFVECMNMIHTKGFAWWFEKLSVHDLNEVSNMIESGRPLVKTSINEAEKAGAVNPNYAAETGSNVRRTRTKRAATKRSKKARK